MFLQLTATYIDGLSQGDWSGTANVDERVQERETDDSDQRIDDPQAKNATTTKTGMPRGALYRVSVKSDNAVRVAEATEEDVPMFPGAPYDRMVAENSADRQPSLALPVMA